MKRSLSPVTLGLIGRIYGDRLVWGRLADADAAVRLVRLVAAQEEPLAARDLLPLVFVADQRIAAAAAHAIHQLVSLIPPGELPWLDEQIRASYPDYVSSRSAWLEIRPGDLSRLPAFEGSWVSLIGLTSCHGSGYVRQAAVELLVRIVSGAELPFLLLRLNDWVADVRAAAFAAVHARLRPEYAEHFGRNLDLVTRLERTTRAQHGFVIDEVLTILKAPENRPVLIDFTHATDRSRRRLGYRLLLEAGHQTIDLLHDALSDIDPVIRFWAVDRAADELTGAVLTDFLVAALRDPVPPVRSRALSGLHRQSPQLAVEHARAALLDSSATLRQQARFFLRQAGSNDFAAHYRDVLTEERSSRTRAAALLGLGETGDSDDALLVKPFCADRLPRVRAAAVWALGQLAGEGALTELVMALQDSSPGVSRQAARALVAYVAGIEPERLWQTFRATAQVHTRRNALWLIASLRKWDSLPLLLQALSDPAVEVRALATAHVRNWLAAFNQSYSVLRPEQRVRLRVLLETHRFVLGRNLYRELEFCIRE
jgi:HEAT repeat protein